MTIEDYRRELGWSQAELSRQAKLNSNTVRKAENGEEVSSQTALALVSAFSNALGRKLLVRDIDGLIVKV